MGGKASRDKGNRSERELKHLLHGAKIRGRTLTARRVPLSGAMSSTGFGGDLLVGERCSDWGLHRGMKHIEAFTGGCAVCSGTGVEQGTEEIWEVKRRATAFKQIYAWLDDAAVLAYRSDKHGWLVTMRLEDYVELEQK